jgi:hypothetical protein
MLSVHHERTGLKETAARHRERVSVESLLWILSLAAAALTPLLLSPWHSNPFELPKALLLRALSGGALILLLVQLARGRRSLSLQTPLVAPALTLAVAVVLATIFSVDSQVSLWGSYERQFGLLTWRPCPSYSCPL